MVNESVVKPAFSDPVLEPEFICPGKAGLAAGRLMLAPQPPQKRASGLSWAPQLVQKFMDRLLLFNITH